MWTVNQEQYLSFEVETIFPGYATNHSSSFQKNSLMTISPVSWQGQLVRAGCSGTADARVRFPTSLNFFTHSFRNSINGVPPELRLSSLCLSTSYNNVCLFVCCCCCCCIFLRKKKDKDFYCFWLCDLHPTKVRKSVRNRRFLNLFDVPFHLLLKTGE